jgi:plasmid stabilization system protein ParE
VKVRYTRSALRQLEQVLSYIEAHSPQGAKKVEMRIQELLGILETQPQIGRKTSDPRIRRIVATPYPYVVLYQIHAGEIIVRTIQHGARKGD